MQMQAKSSARGDQELNRQAEAAGPASIPVDSTTRSEEDREQAICEMAYAFYEARGCADGNDLDDWIRAEARVQQLLDEPPPPSV